MSQPLGGDMAATATDSMRRTGRRRPFHEPDGPRADDGFHGPDSVTWRVWSSPSAYVAAYRSVIVQMLLPGVAAGVDQFSDYTSDPLGRLRRTAHYFAAVALGDTATAEAVARQVRALHGRVEGIEPISGEPYRALDHELLLYVHLTGWHSALVCFERYHEPVGAADRARYWRECAWTTELSGFPGHLVPSTPAGVTAYFERLAPRLAYGVHASNVVDFFKQPRLEQLHLRPLEPALRLLRAATVPTLPRRLQRMTGLEQSAATTVATTALTRAGVRVLWDERLGRFQRHAVPEAYRMAMSARARQADHDAQCGRGHPGPLAEVVEGLRHLFRS